MRTRERIDPGQLDIKDTVVSINRVTKVVKGGKNLSFSALVVVGDGHGVVGFGIGKAKEVPMWDHPFAKANDVRPSGGYANYRTAGLADMALRALR